MVNPNYSCYIEEIQIELFTENKMHFLFTIE